MRAGERTPPLTILLANPRSFCAGVDRAIDTVKLALQRFGAPVYVRHEIVHNRRVVEGLARKGAIFVEDLDEIPTGAVTVFSAHGVARKVEEQAREQSLKVVDATCPLVARVHKEGQRYREQGYEIVLIGHEKHPEVVGTLGQIPGHVYVVATIADVHALPIADDALVAYVSQTTLSVGDTKNIIAALESRWPNAAGPETRDICYATQNRQQAVIDMVEQIDLLLVAGATNSSNSNRLREIGEDHGVRSHLIGDAGQLRPEWLEDIGALGLTAGASAPEVVVQEIIREIARYREIEVVECDGVDESIVFRLPRELDEITPDGAQISARAKAG